MIDALDECDNADDMKRLIGLLATLQQIPSRLVKFFLTSRPDLPIRLGFSADGVSGTYETFVLHDIESSVIEHNISAFLQHTLGEIRDIYNSFVEEEHRFPPIWPEQSNIETLTKMAFPLFISAGTACRFVAEPKINDPNARL